MIIGFHGQTIYHNPKEKISRQLGNGKLFKPVNKKKNFFNFRKNDILNGGEGAPLTPIFHHLICLQKKLRFTSLYFKYWWNFKYYYYKKWKISPNY